MRLKNRRAEFVTDEGGNTVMIFGLSLIPVMFMLGATADYTRYATTRAALQQATDSAALMVASKMGANTTDAQAKNQAGVILAANPRMSSAIVNTAEISTDKQTLCVTSQMTIQNSFMRMVGLSGSTPTAKSCANLAGNVDADGTFEIALVLDNSGSMSSSAGGVSKMQALKNASTNFINTMYSKSNSVKMSIVPFAANVVVLDPTISGNRNKSWIDTQGNNSQHWIVFGGKTAANAQGFNSRFDIFDRLKTLRSSWDWGGCLEEPKYPFNVTETTPTPTDAETLFVPYLAPDEASDSYSNNYILNNGATGGACSDNPSSDWSRLSRACKYKTPALFGDGRGPNSRCPDYTTQTVLNLTPTKATVTGKIAQLDEGGNTNLHAGFMWGWRTLSPGLPFADGRPYSAPKNRKIIVFMTDGYNNWGSLRPTATGSNYEALGYYSYNGAENDRFPDGSAGNNVNYQDLLKNANNTWTNYWGTSRNMLDEMTRQACTNAKAAGIEVFSIGFSTPDDPIDTQGLNLMKSCATNDDHYFAAANADQLNAAFAQIGQGLGKLRLSQ